MARSLSKILGPTPQCTPIAEIVESLEALPGSEVRRHCEQHLSICAHCSTELALYRQFQSTQPSQDEAEAVVEIVKHLRKTSPTARETWWSALWRPRVLAPSLAAAAVAFALFMVVDVHPRLHQPEIQTDDVMRSSQIFVIAPVGELQTAPAELQWQPVAGAVNYRVRMLEVDQTEIWQSTTAAASIRIPDTVKPNITPSRKLVWEVAALDRAGKTISTSGQQTFVLEK